MRPDAGPGARKRPPARRVRRRAVVELEPVRRGVLVAAPEGHPRQGRHGADDVDRVQLRQRAFGGVEARGAEEVGHLLEAVARARAEAGEGQEGLGDRRVGVVLPGGRGDAPLGGGGERPAERHDEDQAAVVVEPVGERDQVRAPPELAEAPGRGRVGHVRLAGGGLRRVQRAAEAHHHRRVAVNDPGDAAVREAVRGADEEQDVPRLEASPGRGHEDLRVADEGVLGVVARHLDEPHAHEAHRQHHEQRDGGGEEDRSAAGERGRHGEVLARCWRGARRALEGGARAGIALSPAA